MKVIETKYGETVFRAKNNFPGLIFSHEGLEVTRHGSFMSPFFLKWQDLSAIHVFHDKDTNDCSFIVRPSHIDRFVQYSGPSGLERLVSDTKEFAGGLFVYLFALDHSDTDALEREACETLLRRLDEALIKYSNHKIQRLGWIKNKAQYVQVLSAAKTPIITKQDWETEISK